MLLNKFKFLILAGFTFLLQLSATGQLISKKESEAIHNLLTKASDQYKPKTYLIQNVSILTMMDTVILRNQDVLIENGFIQAIGSGLQNPRAQLIDGTGKYLMPGLTDMHVHLFDRHPMKETWMFLLLIHGVTSVRDLCGEPGKLILRDQIQKDELLAPNLYQAGPILNGTKDNSGLFWYASTPEVGQEFVISQKKSGYDFIKVYDDLSPEVYRAILEEAQKQEMPVVGHLPNQLTLEEALSLNQHSIEHLTGYFEWKDNQVLLTVPPQYTSLTAASSTWNCPTLHNHYMNGSRAGVSEMMAYAETSGLLPGDLMEIWNKRLNTNSKSVIEAVDTYGAGNFEKLREIVSDLSKANANLIAGTDSGNLPFLIPGYSLHQELKIMNELGISPYDVLKMTTINAAVALNQETQMGTVEVGKRADLLLLNANPLEKLDHLTDKNGMMIRGIWLSEKDIRVLTEGIKSTFAD